MALFGWVMMGLAIWHFTIFLPDRFWGGIVGAFVGAVAGAALVALLIHWGASGTLALPSRHHTHISTILYAIPGAVLGLVGVYWEGMRRERVTQHAG